MEPLGHLSQQHVSRTSATLDPFDIPDMLPPVSDHLNMEDELDSERFAALLDTLLSDDDTPENLDLSEHDVPYNLEGSVNELELVPMKNNLKEANMVGNSCGKEDKSSPPAVITDHQPAMTYHVEDDQSCDEKEVEKYLASFPPGYRFIPSDDELIVDYLQPKVNGQPLPKNLMHVVNIYEYNPEHLTAIYKAQGEKIWYFLTSRVRRYLRGERPSRIARDGFWKASGGDMDIKHKGKKVGYKKTLNFHEGRPSAGNKTSWIMHEFTICDPQRKKSNISSKEHTMRLDDYVLCKIYKKHHGRLKHEVEENVDEAEEIQEAQASVIDSHMPPNNTFTNTYYENTLPMMNIYSHMHHNGPTSHLGGNPDTYCGENICEAEEIQEAQASVIDSHMPPNNTFANTLPTMNINPYMHHYGSTSHLGGNPDTYCGENIYDYQHKNICQTSNSNVVNTEYPALHHQHQDASGAFTNQDFFLCSLEPSPLL